MLKPLIVLAFLASSVTHAQTERIRTFGDVTLDIPENVNLVFYDANIDTSKTFIIGQKTDDGKVKYSFCKTTATVSAGSFSCGEIGAPLSSDELSTITRTLETERLKRNETMGWTVMSAAAVGGVLPALGVSACLLLRRCLKFGKGDALLTVLASGVTAATGGYLSYEIGRIATNYSGSDLDSNYLRQIWMDSLIQGSAGATPAFIKIDDVNDLNRTLSLVSFYKNDILGK